MKVSHSPTPWRAAATQVWSADGNLVARGYDPIPLDVQVANADIMAQAVNTHDGLVKALRGILARHTIVLVHYGEEDRHPMRLCMCDTCKEARAALAVCEQAIQGG